MAALCPQSAERLRAHCAMELSSVRTAVRNEVQCQLDAHLRTDNDGRLLPMLVAVVENNTD